MSTLWNFYCSPVNIFVLWISGYESTEIKLEDAVQYKIDQKRQVELNFIISNNLIYLVRCSADEVPENLGELIFFIACMLL